MADEQLQAQLEEARAEQARLLRENKKLQRQISVLEGTVERYKATVSAKNQLSAILSSEKSKQEKYMNLLLENGPDIILLFDQNGKLLYCTATFLREANIASFGLVDGRGYREIFSRFADEGWVDRLDGTIRQAISENRTIHIDETVDIGGTGNMRSYAIQVAPMLDEQGVAEGSLVLFHDLTEIVQAKQQAEQASGAKSDFLATVSHEIRTPMNAIIGISDMMKRTSLSRQQLDYLSSIQNSSHVLLNLINDILDFSKIEAGKLDLMPEYFSLTGMLAQLEEMFRPIFKEKKIALYCRFDPGLPGVVLGDEKRIRQVLTNILNNALKYTNEGRVRFSVYQEGERIRFDIADTGIGIREEDLPRLFTAFEQLDKVKNKKVVGTGLGLAITRRLCELMSGSIDVQSGYGRGSTFTVRLLLPPGTERDLAMEEGLSYSFVAPDAKVLVVDDIEINLMVAAAMLEMYGIEADQALSGEEALRLVAQNNYDVIFMDHMMPEMDGVETTQAIRAMGGRVSETPIIALTANAVSGAKEMFMQNGLNDFLSKPIDRNALTRSLVKWLPRERITMTEAAEP